MSGVLFVVYIPSEKYELSQRHPDPHRDQHQHEQADGQKQAATHQSSSPAVEPHRNANQSHHQQQQQQQRQMKNVKTDLDKRDNHDVVDLIRNAETTSETTEKMKRAATAAAFTKIPESQESLLHPKHTKSTDIFAISIDSGGSAQSVNNLLEQPATKRLGELSKTKSCEFLNKLISNEGPSKFKRSWDGLKDMFDAETEKAKEQEESLFPLSNDIKLSADSSMEKVMIEIIKKMNIANAAWNKVKNGNFFQIIFSLESGPRCEDTIRLCRDWGVGERQKSSVSVVPCEHYSDPTNEEEFITNLEADILGSKESAWNRFLSSVRARLNVAQIVQEVKADAAITFDFVILLIVAGILAAFGLVENSTLFLAASMLISPLMGPIIAAIFGTVIKDKKLQWIGVVNELIGIFIATAVGFLFGIILCVIDDRYAGKDSGITSEMLSRSELHSVIVGILIALPSGAAVAIAILCENIGSLVGVAISASLLPPAVNAGLLWALSCIHAIYKDNDTKYNYFIKSNFYSDHQSIELAIYGSISMCVTITNVICIYLMGVIFLRIKEVAPMASNSQRQFWKHDIKIARDYNKTIQSQDGISLGKKLVDEITEFQQDGFRGIGAELLRSHHGHHDTWSPMSTRHHFTYKEQSRTSIHDLENLYMNLAGYATHHEGHRIRLPSTFCRTMRNWSPPKYQSIRSDEFLSPSKRRSSNPVDLLSTSNAPKPHECFKSASAPLKKIMENIATTSGSTFVPFENISQFNIGGVNVEPSKTQPVPGVRKINKFTVTPAVEDPLKK